MATHKTTNQPTDFLKIYSMSTTGFYFNVKKTYNGTKWLVKNKALRMKNVIMMMRKDNR